MELKEKIFNEIKRQEITANGIWKFQQYWGVFAVKMLNANEQKEFCNTMKNLCTQQIFIEKSYKSDTVNYILTEYGEHIIYN